MKKYLEIGKINFLNNINYFSEFLFRALFILVILFILTNLWRTIYAGEAVVVGFTLAMMIWYLVMTESLVASSSSVVEEISSEIQTGEVAYKLNKPYSYILYHFVKSLSYKIIGFSLTFLIGAILVFFLVGGIEFNLVNIPMIILVVFLALVLDFFMIFPIALLGFWFEDTSSFKWIYDKIVFTIGGMLIPLEVFPKWLADISNVLPFSFVAYHPAKLFVNFNMGHFFTVILFQVVFIVVFVLLSVLIYKIGVRRVNINGG